MISILSVVLMLGLTWLIVYLTGGTLFVYPHLMYIPIVFSAFLFGVKGGIITAIIGGIVLGPFMPLDVEKNISQSFHAYIYRTIFFILIGGIVGSISTLLKLHLIRVQETLEKMSIIQGKTLINYAKMVAVRDEQVGFHCERVAYNALLVGHALGLKEQNIEALYWSGLLHDVGKIGVKEKILLKPGKLSVEEFEEVKNHTVIGHELITSLSSDMDLVAEGIRSHHEKWNGDGYPDGLKEEKIPLFGRVLSIVDVFEALTSERPYKNAWTPIEAINFIQTHKGIHFDPKLVDIFEHLIQEEKIWISNKRINLNKKIIPSKFNKKLMNY
ncbi:HD-GYP domain-containing protein [Salipaludibacillus sp. CF4.18]|uniref:HD-GYP domain-containing protein n=1 Tax=Salipaludibacillus sp. CF4.18 TaxID=3373081 RepID=UPI003EE61A4F